MLSSWSQGPRHVSPRKGLGPQHATPFMPEPLKYFKAGETYRSEDVAVWVNGSPLPMCTEACVYEGWAMTYVEADGGGIKTDAFGNKILATMRGTVEIRMGR